MRVLLFGVAAQAGWGSVIQEPPDSSSAVRPQLLPRQDAEPALRQTAVDAAAKAGEATKAQETPSTPSRSWRAAMMRALAAGNG
jgi:hypothetical protein